MTRTARTATAVTLLALAAVLLTGCSTGADSATGTGTAIAGTDRETSVTGRQAATEALARVGVTLTITDDQPCGNRPGLLTVSQDGAATLSVEGCARRDAVWLSPAGMDDALPVDLAESVRNTARHEAAHAVIWRICGTNKPVVAGERWENVADAYAVRYEHASSTASGGYGYTAADAAAADRIAASDCTGGTP